LPLPEQALQPERVVGAGAPVLVGVGVGPMSSPTRRRAPTCGCATPERSGLTWSGFRCGCRVERPVSGFTSDPAHPLARVHPAPRGRDRVVFKCAVLTSALAERA